MNAQSELAAVGVAFYLTWAMTSFLSSLSTGTQVLTSRSVGSGNYAESGSVLTTALILAVAVGLMVSAFVLTFSRFIAGLFVVDQRVSTLTVDFLRYRFWGFPLYLVSAVYRGFYFGIGKTRVFMFAATLANVSNIALDYVLIFGMFGFHGMGLAGAGLGASIAAVIETCLYVVVSASKSYRSTFRLFTRIRFHKSIATEILKISLPVSFQGVSMLTGLLLCVSMIERLGTIQQAATQVVLSALLLSYLPSIGFGIGAQSLVGRRIGQGDIQHARQCGFETSRLSTVYTLVLGLVFILFPKYILSVLTGSSAIIELSIPILRIAGVAQIFFGIGLVLASGLLAVGESLFVLLTDVAANWFVFIPLAYFFGIVLKLGLRGQPYPSTQVFSPSLSS